MDLTKPTIHLNGTSGNALLDGYTAAAGALHEALRQLDQAAPNARDYYVQGDDAFAAARREHDARTARVRETLREISVLAEHVADASE